MSTMEDMTRSVRVTYVYNGRHDQISEGHLCIIGRLIFTEAVKLTSPQRESNYDQMSEVRLSTETD